MARTVHRLTITGDQNGDYYANTLTFHAEDSGVHTVYDTSKAIADYFNSAAHGLVKYAACINDLVNFHTIRCRCISPGGQEYVIIQNLLYATAGTVAGSDMLPTNIAGPLKFPTAFPRRSGKVFMPGVSEVHTATGKPTASYITLLTALATELTNSFTVLTTIVCQLCIFNAAKSPDVVDLLTFRADPYFWQQGRRRYPV